MLRLAENRDRSSTFGSTRHVFKSDSINLDRIPTSPLIAHIYVPFTGSMVHFSCLAITVDRIEIRLVLGYNILLIIECHGQLATILSRPVEDHSKDSIVLPEANVTPILVARVILERDGVIDRYCGLLRNSPNSRNNFISSDLFFCC